MTNQYWTCTGLHGLKSMIRKTERVSLMPGHAFRIEAKAGELKGLRLTDPTSSRKLNLLRLKHIQLPPYADLFIDALHAAAEDHVWV
jgi:DNA-binding transcriptional LysR family regulator